jgi:hypothetical protein
MTAVDRGQRAGQAADADLEERLLMLIARLERRVAGMWGKGSRSAVKLLEPLAGMVEEITAASAPGPDGRRREEFLEIALTESRKIVPELVQVRQRRDRLSLALAGVVDGAWRDEPGERRQVFTAIVRGLVTLIGILFGSLGDLFETAPVRSRFAETAAVFFTDLETVALQLEF